MAKHCYLSLDELARIRWLRLRREELITLLAGRGGKPWEIEVGAVVSDCIVMKAQLFTKGRLFGRKLRLAAMLADIGQALGLRIELVEMSTSTTLVYHAFPADLEQFRTIPLRGNAARRMRSIEQTEELPRFRKARRTVTTAFSKLQSS